MKADATPVANLSAGARQALGKVAAAKDDNGRAEAVKTLSGDPDIAREVAGFAAEVKARFGEDGARAMLRASAARKPFEHPSVPKSAQASLDQATKFYAAARSGEREMARMAESERLGARQIQGAKLKP
ncbi:hypothetical protein ACFSQT_17325 [Mesorhizobium calcicola]|uniref:Uncharacterized protein n=1 Tax=Mesorhizobium calcicola TaxID=1300310 RepID=A0ABW4WH22_9HYPH